VRIGNGAASQFQLDVFGELVDAVWQYRQHGGGVDDTFWELLTRVGGAVLDLWREPDRGIWEIRGEPRHFVFSKVMAWVALDRLLRLAELDDREGDVDLWRRARDEIRETVEREGVDDGVFTQSFGDRGKLDASNLMLPLVGFVEPGDPRARATVEAIASRLSANGLVYRYVTDGMDGLRATRPPSSSAPSGSSTAWRGWATSSAPAVRTHARLRQRRRSARRGDRTAVVRAPRQLPQAFSHLGLIQAALALAETEG
jgi:GH15 family glucan-1,4-alpha-glucosidase